MIDNRFTLIKKIGSGGQGQVGNKDEFMNERALYRRLAESNQQKFSWYIKSGQVDKTKFYIAMKLMGSSLKQILRSTQVYLNIQQIALIGIQLIEQLSLIHQIGYVHWDIKPENILFQNKYSVIKEDTKFQKIQLIDFGVSRPFINSLGNHYQNIKQEQFAGNLYFSSHFQMLGNGPSRRDDIISIIYFLLYLKQGYLPWICSITQPVTSEKYNNIVNLKKNYYNILENQFESNCILKKLLSYSYQLEFQDEPDYAYLQQKNNNKKNKANKKVCPNKSSGQRKIRDFPNYQLGQQDIQEEIVQCIDNDPISIILIDRQQQYFVENDSDSDLDISEEKKYNNNSEIPENSVYQAVFNANYIKAVDQQNDV
ncbi:protein kinase domain containing protein [Stylonychia lemnae]|uniref:Casein kinase I n=1 Tax=Stylonychia lemnae TaxID=5949 RepID=A0A078AIM5_STYLE|nr:protein kinase domain containing protein [Stylonychia lemnae]|eukprot:CDW81786.1 protein kinase domain containing protein [Stylonychia lemnae]